ncbi:MAG: glycosyltransferase [Spirochaetales bacterium]|nr:glycosyltransferase [candidate division WOR-3 bacterium]MCK4540993.1 glycosyltransferase [Spirochaetales bacterium]
MEKKVLIITYYFPPVGGGGVQRTAKFVKYLPEFGWNPFILTVKEEVCQRTKRPIDRTLLDDIPENIYIKRTNSKDLLQYKGGITSEWGGKGQAYTYKRFLKRIAELLINPDSQMPWIPIAVMSGFKMILKNKIDVIYSTGNPWSNHIVGAILKKLTNRPWVADFRDPWTLNPFQKYSSKFRYEIHCILEKKVFEIANKIIFTSQQTADDYRKIYRTNKFAIITNGFDEEDFKTSQVPKCQGLNILYSGNIIANFKSSSMFIYALSKFLEKNSKSKKDIKVNFLGSVDARFKSLFEKGNFAGVINALGYKSHRESISMILSADVLLLMRNELGRMIIPGKLFEYMASGKPILALIPINGSAAIVLKNEGRDDFIVNPNDLQGIEKKIELIYWKYKQKLFQSYRTDNLDRYTRKNLAGDLSAVLDEIRRS